MMTPKKLQSYFNILGIETNFIKNEQGGLAMFANPGARLIGLWPNPNGPNLLWTNPVKPKNIPSNGGWENWEKGGLGGDRLWFGPEYKWFFDGKPKAQLENWQVPFFMDPGEYKFNCNDKSISLSQKFQLEENKLAAVRRSFSLLNNEPSSGFYSISIKEKRGLEMNISPQNLQLDLWSISQIPVGSKIIIPTHEKPKIGVSFELNTGEIFKRSEIAENYFAWEVTGSDGVKGSLPVSQVIGLIGVIQQHESDCYSLFVRHFSPNPEKPYLDGLFEHQVKDQCIQWWDGFGFGEVECHSPTITGEDHNISEEHFIHSFYGSGNIIKSLAEQYLRIKIEDRFFDS